MTTIVDPTALSPERAASLRVQFDALDELLSEDIKWTQTVGARNASGLSVNPNDPQAVCWCLLGGAFRVTHSVPGRQAAITGRQANEDYAQIMLCFRHAMNNMGHSGITIGELNDDSDFAAIKVLIGKARDILPHRDASLAAA